MKFRSLLCAAVLPAFLLGTAAAKAETYNATVVTGHPAVFLWVKMLTEVFVPTVNKELEKTAHKINWTEAYGGTVAKVGGELEAMESGLAQITIGSGLFEPSLLPLQNITYMTPFAVSDVDQVLGVIDRLHDEIPDLRATWEKYDMEYLANFGLEDYLLISKFPVTKLEDLKGHKISAPGPAVNWLSGTGAVGVSGNLTTYYTDLQTGVTDGVIVFPTAAAPAKLPEVAKYVTRTHFGAQHAGAIVAKKSWMDTLPPEVQQAIKVGADAYAKAYREGLASRVDDAFKALAASGAVITDLDEGVRTQWAMGLPPIARDWAADLDSKGLPGTKVLGAYMQGLRDAGAKPSRNWDQQ